MGEQSDSFLRRITEGGVLSDSTKGLSGPPRILRSQESTVSTALVETDAILYNGEEASGYKHSFRLDMSSAPKGRRSDTTASVFTGRPLRLEVDFGQME